MLFIFCLIFQKPNLEARYLLEGVAVNQSNIYAAIEGDIWTTALKGGLAQQVTDSLERDAYPIMSPDGKSIVFTRRHGRGDVILRDLASGEEKQLTYHPAFDYPVGWRSDQVLLIASDRDFRGFRLYEIDIYQNGLPRPLPFPNAYWATITVNQSWLFMPYGGVPYSDERVDRSGNMGQIYLADNNLSRMEKWSPVNYECKMPQAYGNSIYYLSDEDGVFNLYQSDLAGKKNAVTKFKEFGVRSFAVFDSNIVVVRDGQIYLCRDGGLERVPLQLPPPQDPERFIADAFPQLESFQIHPRENRVLLAARGDIFSWNYEDHSIHNLSQSSNIREREVAISPDGRFLATFSFLAENYHLTVKDLQSGKQQHFPLQMPFPRNLIWSPNSRAMLFEDRNLCLWLWTLNNNEPIKIHQAEHAGHESFSAVWHPDGQWFSFVARNQSGQQDVLLFDVDANKTHNLTENQTFAVSPKFDVSGKYLYFIGYHTGQLAFAPWSLLSALQHRLNLLTHLYVVPLERDGVLPVLSPVSPNPLVQWEKKDPFPEEFSVGWLPLPEVKAVQGLYTSEPGKLMLDCLMWESSALLGVEPRRELYEWNLRFPQKLRIYLESYDGPQFQGNRVAWRDGRSILVRDTEQSDKTFRTSFITLPVRVERAEEWALIFDEAWYSAHRMFYDPELHGHGQKLKAHFRQYLPFVRSREGLNALIRQSINRVSISHFRVSGGAGLESRDQPSIGFLGGEFATDQNRYRLKSTFNNGPFHVRQTREGSRMAGLNQWGQSMHVGDYLLSINGTELYADQNLFKALRHTVGNAVKLEVSTQIDGPRRIIRLYPADSDHAMWRAQWANRNQQWVEEQSQGKVGYVHLGSFDEAGIQDFVGHYLAQRDKSALIIDQRHNGGGITSDALIEMLARKPIYHYYFRHGSVLDVPEAAPQKQVLLINERDGSAAETFALMFKQQKLGTLVGRPTGGAGIGGSGWQPRLMDGGKMTIPNRAAFVNGQGWTIENRGVQPDVLVEMTLDHEDAQLAVALKEALKAPPKPQAVVPAFPRYN